MTPFKMKQGLNSVLEEKSSGMRSFTVLCSGEYPSKSLLASTSEFGIIVLKPIQRPDLKVDGCTTGMRDGDQEVR
jgi:hypothetical protein